MRRGHVVWGGQPADSIQIEISKAQLKKLRQLCHPDRHGGSDLSREVSQWLNELSKTLDTKTKL